GRSARPRRDLARIELGDVLELGFADTGEQRVHDGMLALAVGIFLHFIHEILRRKACEARNARLAGDAALAMAGPAGDDLVARVTLVGLDRRAQISRVLAGKARKRIRKAAASFAVASNAERSRRFARRRIAKPRGLGLR